MTRSEAAKILGVSPKANEDEIKKAFRIKAMRFHPDRNNSPNARSVFIEIHEAYEYLTELATGKKWENTSNSSTQHHSHAYSRFRSSHHKHRNYTDPYQNMSREEFEQRFYRAQRAAEEAFNRKSNLIYRNSLDEYQNSWLHSLAKVFSIIGLILSLLFILDYALDLKQETIPNSQVSVTSKFYQHHATLYVHLRGNTYQLPDELKYIYKNQSSLTEDKKKVSYALTTTSLFKDIVGLSIQTSQAKELLKPTFSAYGSFPIVPILLLIPIISLWFEKPNFNFVFFVVNYNIYVFPILIIVLLFHDMRLFRLFGL